MFGRDAKRRAVKPVAGLGDDGGEDAEAPPQAGRRWSGAVVSQFPQCDWKGVCWSAFEQTGAGHLFTLAAFSYRLIFVIRYK